MVLLLSDEHRVPFGGILDYTFSNFHNCLYLNHEEMELLKLDCQEAFTCRSIHDADESYSSGSTYFLKSDQNPRCQLEQLALSIFQLHTKDAIFASEFSGAEWWTQVIDCRDDIGFHWDRDYGLEEDTGQHIHPHLATVTYLTDLGGPTLILNKIGTQNEKESNSGVADEIIVSRPMLGKHIKFDGRLLHAAPCDLLEEEHEDTEEEDSESDSSSTNSKIEKTVSVCHTVATAGENSGSHPQRSGISDGSASDVNSYESDDNDNDSDDDEDDDKNFPKRITFLVNIWLNHIPMQSIEFPVNRLCNMQTFLNCPQTSSSSSSSCFRLGSNIAVGHSNKSPLQSDTPIISDEDSPIFVPSIELQSTLKSKSKRDSSKVTGMLHNDIETYHKYQHRKWRFCNGGVKYEVTVPLPAFSRLQSLNIDYDAFRLLYSASGEAVTVDAISSKKRKAIKNLDIDSGR